MKKGDCIGIAAPSSAFDPDDFDQGLALLRGMGFELFVPEGLYKKKAFLAGSDGHRVSVINDLFENPRVKAILCARGGYGSMRILDHINGDLVRENPKLFVGFSDATALLSHLYQAWGLVCYHGPVVCSLGRSDQQSLDALEHVLLTGTPKNIEAPFGRVLIPGQARGILMGGNLATLCHLTGTSYQPDLSGTILMLEDVGEAAYKIDRMLVQMKYAGLFDGLNGVVLGSFEKCGDPDHLADIFLDVFGDLKIPLVMDFSFGHGASNCVFPIGVDARLHTDSLSVVF